MKRYSLALAGFFLGICLSAGIRLMVYNYTPVGSVDGHIIYTYQLKKYPTDNLRDAISMYADDEAFMKVCKNLNICASKQNEQLLYDKAVKMAGGGEKLNERIIQARDEMSVKIYF